MIPGDEVRGEKLGPGVWAAPGASPFATITGELVQGRATYIAGNGRRYTPARGDFVIGHISQKLSEIYRVQLQEQSRPVRLDIFAFEGANKKNRPNLQVGDVVYARVVHADQYSDANIECMDGSGKSAGFGPLVGGTLVRVSLGFARHLLFKGHPLLERLGQRYTFEMAIGVNGVVWVKAGDDEVTLEIAREIERAGAGAGA